MIIMIMLFDWLRDKEPQPNILHVNTYKSQYGSSGYGLFCLQKNEKVKIDKGTRNSLMLFKINDDLQIFIYMIKQQPFFA